MGWCQSTEKEQYITRSVLQRVTAIFACRIVVIALLRSNIKARHEIPEFLNSNL